ncbi:MAG: thioredoxin family protein [Dechloromonas sp.]|nr:thioredoxin family protein [Dechloromonas sp.]
MNDSYAEIAPTRDEINALQEPVLIEFGAPWCGHCQAAQPLLTAALAAYPQLAHLKIEDGPGRPLGRSFRVKLWPTLIFFRQGVEIARLVRPSDAAQISEAIEQLVTP